MKKYIIITVISFLLTSCSKEDCCIRDLECFVSSVEYGYPRYYNSDWERVIERYSKYDSSSYSNYINSLSPEEIEKVKQLKNRYHSVVFNRHKRGFHKNEIVFTTNNER